MKENTSSFHISSIELTSHVHATEDLEKVKQAFLFLLPESLHGKLSLNVKKVIGHWNNPLSLLQAKFTDADDAIQIIKHLANSLSDREKQVLKRGLDRRIDKSHLYLRLDKQAAFNKYLLISDEDDVIRLKVGFTIFHSPSRDKIKSICENLLAG